MKKEFKELLLTLDLDSNKKIYDPLEEVKIQISTMYDDILKIEVVLKIFKNKTSFLYNEFELYQDSDRIQNIANKININSSGKICRVDWQINHNNDPRLLTTFDNKKILFSFIKNVKEIIKNGNDQNTPKQNDILVGFPWDGSLISSLHHPENARKRSILNKKFGFGEVDQYNYQYAIYDKNLNLNPI